MTLSVDTVKRLTEPGRYGDGGGLYLVMAPGGSKSWVLRVQKAGKRTDKGLGGYPAVSLAAARRLAEDTRVAIRHDGLDVGTPKAEGQPATKPAPRRRNTFEAIARNVHAMNTDAGTWCPGNAKQWLQRAESYLFPTIGGRRIDDIQVQILRDDILRPLASEHPETGKRVRIIMRQTFQQAVEDGLLEANPVDRIPAARLKRPVPTHRKALDYRDVPAALQHLDRYRGVHEGRPSRASLLCLSFMVLTAARPGEARRATWEEIDLEARTWTIPAAKMKARRDHVVPLSPEALFVLFRARKLSDGQGWIFPKNKGQAISSEALNNRMKKDGLDCVPHGFRSSFRDWAAETSGAGWETIELSLAHQIGTTTTQAYFRSTLLEQRRPLMDAWGDYVLPDSKAPF